MNIFNQKAADAGRDFMRNFPQATNVEIDQAAPKFNPARRHFQEAAHAIKDRLRRMPTWHRWELSTETYTVVGFSETFEEARKELNLMVKLEREAGYLIQSRFIEDSAGNVRSGWVNRYPPTQ